VAARGRQHGGGWAIPWRTHADRRSAGYWEKLRFPFRWNDIVSALDAITRIPGGGDAASVETALQRLVDRQQPSGLCIRPYEQARERTSTSG
jgi:hypothetical protein